MNKKQIIVSLFSSLLLATFYLLPVDSVFADYVLPYPSYMPGNKMYKVSRIIDGVKKYWYWGSIGGVKYHLALSDKYLVEAKTLFEYKQYLLAVDALTRSDFQYQQISQFLTHAKKEGKDIALLKQSVREASLVHIQTLDTLRQMVPSEYSWTPEKATPTVLPLHQFFDTAIEQRKNIKSIQ